ncbi:helix-turn-helix transcriptional regulator [Saprospiraceae bacterium]|nr:helix-turn-helix transcriptional regulator [Saprospiraceae bacterium]
MSQTQISYIKTYPKSIPLLSDREKEVLIQLSLGYTNHEIGLNLRLSHHTVNSHRKRLIMKFDSKNTANLVRKGIKLGFISLRDDEK